MANPFLVVVNWERTAIYIIAYKQNHVNSLTLDVFIRIIQGKLVNLAGVAELEYALVLGTNLARVVGSSPTAGTIKKHRNKMRCF